MKQAVLALLVAFAVLIATACGAEDPVGGPEQPESTVEEATVGEETPPTEVPEVPEDAVDLTDQSQIDIVVGDNNFTPQVIVISPQTQVTWTNEGRNKHNVISAADEPAFEQIDTEVLDNGGRDSRTFDQVGAYPYYCSIHGSPNRGQRGSIVVLPDA